MAFTGPHGEPLVITGNSPDVSARPETSAITRVEFTRDNFFVRHTKEPVWPMPIPPGWDGGIQWTLWIVFQVDGQWYTSGTIEFWKDPTLGVWRGQEPAPFSSGQKNWWYHAPPMATRQPPVGEVIGIFVTAGAQRMKDVTSDPVTPPCVERSPIVWLTVPANDTGVFTFDATTPIPTPEPEPEPPVNTDAILAAIAEVHDEILALKAQMTADTQRMIDVDNANTEKVQQQIHQVIEDAEETMMKIAPVLIGLLRAADDDGSGIEPILSWQARRVKRAAEPSGT